VSGITCYSFTWKSWPLREVADQQILPHFRVYLCAAAGDPWRLERDERVRDSDGVESLVRAVDYVQTARSRNVEIVPPNFLTGCADCQVGVSIEVEIAGGQGRSEPVSPARLVLDIWGILCPDLDSIGVDSVHRTVDDVDGASIVELPNSLAGHSDCEVIERVAVEVPNGQVSSEPVVGLRKGILAKKALVDGRACQHEPRGRAVPNKDGTGMYGYWSQEDAFEEFGGELAVAECQTVTTFEDTCDIIAWSQLANVEYSLIAAARKTAEKVRSHPGEGSDDDGGFLCRDYSMALYRALTTEQWYLHRHGIESDPLYGVIIDIGASAGHSWVEIVHGDVTYIIDAGKVAIHGDVSPLLLPLNLGLGRWVQPPRHEPAPCERTTEVHSRPLHLVGWCPFLHENASKLLHHGWVGPMRC
jgi:hypothetical protein